MKNIPHKNYNLSYPVSTVSWNGSTITRLPWEKIEKHLEILHECGIREVMLSGYTDVEKAEFNMMEACAELGEKLKSCGMSSAQHHGLSPMFAPLDDLQEEVIEQLIRSVRYTALLGAKVLVIHSGRIVGHHSDMQSVVDKFMQEKDLHGLDRVIQTCGKNLHKAGKAAQEAGIKIAIENLDRFEPLGNMELLPRLVDAADSPAVGYCLDSGHAHCCGNSVTEWIRIMGNKLFTTHFHDNRGTQGMVPPDNTFVHPEGIDEHMPPGFGTIPWINVIQALWSAGYENTVNFESGGWVNLEEKEGYLSAIRFWRTCEFLAEKKL